ncbi:hypothetical protein B0H63DRAFT_464806 [Podospora didyma]|uniref:Uncharacterized protein n=1 Tax=Podospora didyma TaxID=330526 RepID=A0AAE0U4E6_9PEZI|nr:hypothetical protein B0H63DRAFT_464806 [Podospora didyma]
MCDNNNPASGPFCSPRDGAQLQVGKTVDVIWNPAFFNSSFPRQLRVQADFSTRPEDAVKGGADGFTSRLLNVSTGRFTWNVLSEYLGDSSRAGASRPARLFITQPAPDEEDDEGDEGDGIARPVSTSTRAGGENRIAGPRVQLIAGPNALGSSMPNPLTIALPIVFGVLTVLIMVGFVLFKRRKPDFSFKNIFTRRGRVNGYGERKSRGQRVRGMDIKHHVGMNTLPTGVDRDRNVFQEEMRRQQDRRSDW